MSVAGMCRNTGKKLTELDHLKQSIIDILTTPIGSRVMLRDYGSRLFDLLDQPINNSLKVRIYVATAEAIAKWEPRFKCTKVSLISVENGRLELLLEGEYLPSGQKIQIDRVVV